MDSLTIVLHSLSQWSEYEGPPMSHSLESVYSRPVTDASPE